MWLDDRTLELIQLAIDGEATQNDRAELDAILASSPEARAMFEAMKDVARQLDAVPMAEPPGVRPAVMEKIRSSVRTGFSRSRPTDRLHRTGPASAGPGRLKSALTPSGAERFWQSSMPSPRPSSSESASTAWCSSGSSLRSRRPAWSPPMSMIGRWLRALRMSRYERLVIAMPCKPRPAWSTGTIESSTWSSGWARQSSCNVAPEPPVLP